MAAGSQPSTDELMANPVAGNRGSKLEIEREVDPFAKLVG